MAKCMLFRKKLFDFDNDVDVRGWLMSLKLDGIRAIWDGSRMWTRTGNELFPPKYILEKLPSSPLDGEISAPERNFSLAQSIVRSSKVWDPSLRFCAFDIPITTIPFYKRLETLYKLQKKYGFDMIPYHTIRSKRQLRMVLNRVVRTGGEGIVIRDPNGMYKRGRTNDVIKVKPNFEGVARLVEHTDNGAMLVGVSPKEIAGVEFTVVGTIFRDSKNRDRFNFIFQGRSEHGKPLFPMYFRKLC